MSELSSLVGALMAPRFEQRTPTKPQPPGLSRGREVARQIGDANRGAILLALENGPANLCALAEATGMARKTISTHLVTLQASGLIRRYGAGRKAPWMLTPENDFEDDHRG